MTNPGNSCCNRNLKATRKDEEIQEATTSLAAAKEISMDAAAGAFLSEQDDIFTLKDEQRTALKEHGFTLLLTGFSKSSVQQSGASHLASQGAVMYG